MQIGRITAFGSALEVANLTLAITSTGFRASAAGSFAGVAVIADVDLRKNGSEIDGDQVRFAVNASNVNLGPVVQRLWGSGAPTLVTNTLGSATFARLSSQNRKGERQLRLQVQNCRPLPSCDYPCTSLVTSPRPLPPPHRFN